MSEYFKLGYLPERLQLWANLKNIIGEIREFKRMQQEIGIIPKSSEHDGK